MKAAKMRGRVAKILFAGPLLFYDPFYTRLARFILGWIPQSNSATRRHPEDVDRQPERCPPCVFPSSGSVCLKTQMFDQILDQQVTRM